MNKVRKRELFTFDQEQLRSLSEICRDIAQVFFASMVVSPFLIVDSINWLVVVSGGGATGMFWFLSILFSKKL